MWLSSMGRYKSLGLVLVVFGLALAAGCSDDNERPPFAPSTDGSTRDVIRTDPPKGGGPRDAGGMSDADASGENDAGLPTGCVDVPEDDLANRARVSFGSSPVEFDVTRAFVTWNTSPCTPGTLFIGLGETDCSPRSRHQLLFALDRDEIGESIAGGPNTLGEDDFPIRVRYTAPLEGDPLETHTWGTCAGSDGIINFDVVPSPAAKSRFRATFDLALTDCDAIPTLADVFIDGAFDVVLDEAFDDVCK